MVSKLVAFFCLSLGLWSGSATADLKKTWVTDDGLRIAPKGEIKNQYNIQNQEGTIVLFGMPNETIAFQLVLEGGETKSQIQLQLTGFKGIENGTNPTPKSTPFLNQHIQWFEAKSVAINERSHDLSWMPKSKAEPSFGFNNVFEPLAVFKNPITVPAKERRVVWIDIWIPKDMPKGKTLGTLTIIDKHKTNLNIELEIGSHPLPDSPTTKTMLWSSVFENQSNYVLGRYYKTPTESQTRSLRLAHHHLAKRHRVTLANGVYNGNTTDAMPFLRGDAYTSTSGYSGPGEGLGDDLLVLKTYGGDLSAQERDQWKRELTGLTPKPEVIHYTYDEPKLNDKTIALINTRSSQSQPFKSFVTHSYDSRLSVNVFASSASNFRLQSLNDPSRYTSWIYNGVRPHTGSFAIDDVAVSPRVNPWIQYKHNIPRWFYWEATYYDDFQGKKGQRDVWKQGANFSNKHGDVMNGDGLLFYPGTDLLFPESSQGVLYPLPSIRLKNWRRGIEDVEYLVMAKAKGLYVKRFIHNIIPKSLNQLDSKDKTSWPQHGKDWRNIRKSLFDYLEDQKGSSHDMTYQQSQTEDSPFATKTILKWIWALPGMMAVLMFVYFKTKTHP